VDVIGESEAATLIRSGCAHPSVMKYVDKPYEHTFHIMKRKYSVVNPPSTGRYEVLVATCIGNSLVHTLSKAV
jgi:hypothetical protein